MIYICRLNLRGKFNKTIVRPVALDGSECWHVKGANERKVGTRDRNASVEMDVWCDLNR